MREDLKKLDIKKTIPIPHLRADVHLLDLSKVRGIDDNKGSAYTFIIGTDEKTLHLDLAIGIKDIENTLIPENSFMLAHEFMHVIQILCQERNMVIQEEKEHTAFLMSYLMEKSLI